MKKNRARQERKNILDEYRLSNLSGAQFCRNKKIHLQTFYIWLRKEKSIENESKLKFVSLSVEESAPKITSSRTEKKEGIILKTKNGNFLKIPLSISASWVSSLLKELM
jgi:hypothetical protein